jgi:Zn-finger nucleic acid-binding protein
MVAVASRPRPEAAVTDSAEQPAAAKPCAKCPSTPLENVPGHDFSVDRCPECGGTWFEGTTLDKALRNTPDALFQPPPRPPDPGANARKGLCPACKTPMIKVNSLTSPRIIMDVCKVCGGKWLDGGEFMKIRGRGLFAKLKRLFGY